MTPDETGLVEWLEWWSQLLCKQEAMSSNSSQKERKGGGRKKGRRLGLVEEREKGKKNYSTQTLLDLKIRFGLEGKIQWTYWFKIFEEIIFALGEKKKTVPSIYMGIQWVQS